MKLHSRRSFLGLAGAVPTLAGSRQELGEKAALIRARTHPLDGIVRENLKITDIKVTLMSYELPRDRQWLTGTMTVWKTDAVLVDIHTDKGIVGIGESSPYGGPESIKKIVDQTIRPVLLGKNPFDVEYRACGWGGPHPNYIAWAGIDLALRDIARGLTL